MKRWNLIRNSDGDIRQDWLQEEAPGEEYLHAFGDPSQFTLQEETLGYLDELHVIRQRRAENYPSLTELADALYHSQNGNNAPLLAYYEACEAVKAAHQKPTPPEGVTEPNPTPNRSWWQIFWS